MAVISRMDFLRGALKGRKEPVRPPWASDARSFAALCDGCGDCVRACSVAILVAGRGGLPEVDFRRGACTFCGECVAACPTGALSQAKVSLVPPWALMPDIGEQCLAKRAIVCRTCGDRCDPRAIRFRLAPGGVSRLEIDSDACTGCGACAAACPAQAITLINRTETLAGSQPAQRGAVA